VKEKKDLAAIATTDRNIDTEMTCHVAYAEARE
jgi:hypothetical protein